MNTAALTTWIARHKVRTALIALLVVILCWDWFALPQLLLALTLPLVVLTLPLLIPAAVIYFLVRRLRRPRPSAPSLATGRTSDAPAPRPLSALELEQMHEQHPERFDGIDFDAIDERR